ncbi:MAG: DUF1206 domain-containing protein [Candidatus Dormibacter sp.]
MARVGLAARGLTYLIIALIAAQIAEGRTTQSADQHGAIEDVAAQPFGRFLLIALAVGFAAYALWRLSVALTGGPGSGPKQAVRRLGAAATAVVYAGLCVTSVLVVAGHSATSSTKQQQSATGWLLGLPLGRLLVIAIGVGLVVGGCALAWRAIRKKFEGKLAMQKMGPRMRSWAIGLGVVGNTAVGIVVILVGILLIQAAASDDAGASKGLDQTLRTLAAAPFGTALLLAVALGLVAYGLSSFVEARFRRV